MGVTVGDLDQGTASTYFIHMKVGLLAPNPDRIMHILRDQSDEVMLTDMPIDLEWAVEREIDFLVSYGYRHILRAPLIGRIPAVNLHISYLPWNRGADPNLWSWIEDTPKGVTIHEIDEGVDTGPIIAQRTVSMGMDETLASSYTKLCGALETLFLETWPLIRTGQARSHRQTEGGSFHLLSDRAAVSYLLTDGWQTSVRQLAGINSKPRRA